MSDSRKPTNEDVIADMNKLDVELSDTYGGVEALVKALNDAPSISIEEYNDWNTKEYTGFKRALNSLFVSSKATPEAMREVNFAKTFLLGASSDHDRYAKAIKQINDIKANPDASSAEKEYAYKLQRLTTMAEERVGFLQQQKPSARR